VLIVDHLKDFVPNVKNYEAVQNFPMWENRNPEDLIFLGDFIPCIGIFLKC
jgi:hypothetical protein